MDDGNNLISILFYRNIVSVSVESIFPHCLVLTANTAIIIHLTYKIWIVYYLVYVNYQYILPHLLEL